MTDQTCSHNGRHTSHLCKVLATRLPFICSSHLYCVGATENTRGTRQTHSLPSRSRTERWALMNHQANKTVIVRWEGQVPGDPGAAD